MWRQQYSIVGARKHIEQLSRPSVVQMCWTQSPRGRYEITWERCNSLFANIFQDGPRNLSSNPQREWHLVSKNESKDGKDGKVSAEMLDLSRESHILLLYFEAGCKP